MDPPAEQGKAFNEAIQVRIDGAAGVGDQTARLGRIAAGEGPHHVSEKHQLAVKKILERLTHDSC